MLGHRTVTPGKTAVHSLCAVYAQLTELHQCVLQIITQQNNFFKSFHQKRNLCFIVKGKLRYRAASEFLLFLVTGRAFALIVWKGLGREKFVKREFYLLELVAGIVGCACAFLFRYTEIVNRNEHLYIANKLNNREKSDGYDNLVFNR